MEAKQSHTLTLKLNSNSGSSIIPLPELSALSIPEGATKISEAIELKNFKAYSRITSVDVSPLPSFDLEDTDTDRLVKTLDIEWKSPRKQLNLYVGNIDNWFLVGSVSLLNPNGYPYRMYDLLQIYNSSESGFIGGNVRLALQIQDVGFGLLQGNDIVSVYLDLLRHFSYFLPTTVVNNIINTNSANSLNNGSNNGNGGNDNVNENDEEMTIQKITSNYTITQNKERILCDTFNGGNITVTMPNTPANGWELDIVHIGSGGAVLLVLPVGQKIDGVSQSSSPGLNEYARGGKFVFFDGEWYRFLSRDTDGGVAENTANTYGF